MFEPFRIIPSKCQVEKAFIHCDDVAVKDVLGEPNPFYIDGRLKFPECRHEKPDGTYQTIIGPWSYNTGVVLARSDSNMSGGLTRLTGIREPLKVVKEGLTVDFSDKSKSIEECVFDAQQAVASGGEFLHYVLCDNQRRFYATNDVYNKMEARMAKEIKLYFDDWLDDFEVRIEQAALNPLHSKVKLRVPAWHEDIQGDNNIKHRTWVVKNNGFVKINPKGREIAKPNKYIRITYDLGTPASLVVGDFVERIKGVICNMDLVYNTRFVKSPDLYELTTVFERLISPPDKFHFVYFSDDSCIAIRCKDGIFRANLDIAGCDASHTEKVFDSLDWMTSGNKRLSDVIKRAIRQCSCDLVLRSRANGRNKVKFAVEVKLFTGSILTTLINNIANCFIAASIQTELLKFGSELKMSDCEKLIATASQLAGYIVTCQVCHNVQQLQFLKHSPCYSLSGRVVPVQNIGVILRTIGRCWGDLPVYRKGMSFDERRDEYNRRQVSCYKRGPRHSLLHTLCHRYSPGAEIGESSCNDIAGDLSFEHVCDEQIALRYGIPASSVRELAESYAEGNKIINVVASRKVMELDYGL